MTAKTPTSLAWALLLAVPLAAAACNRTEQPATTDAGAPSATETPPPGAPGIEPLTEGQLRVRDVELGRAIGADGRVTDDTDDFRPTDTIYASVETDGTAASAELTARWTYQDGQVVDESTQTIAPTGPAVTEFHIARPSGWPAGRYRLEVLLDGRVVETEEFEVK